MAWKNTFGKTEGECWCSNRIHPPTFFQIMTYYRYKLVLN